MRSRILAAALVVSLAACNAHFEQRDMPTFRRRGYNADFWWRHKDAYRTQAAIHIAHAYQHDALELTRALEGAKLVEPADRLSDDEYLRHRPAPSPLDEPLARSGIPRDVDLLEDGDGVD